MIPDDLATFLVSGISFYVGTRDAELEPHGTRAWALAVADDREHAVVFVPERAASRILSNLEDNGRIAIAASRPTDHRSCQLKGTFIEARPCLPAERDEVARQADGFLCELETIGIPRTLTAAWTIWPCVAVRLRVEHVYEQTPGPGAGDALR
jgi:hypothetical protein